MAAKFAVDVCGAKYGQASGLQGQSYAIITKDLNKGRRSIPLSEIENQLVELMQFAECYAEKTFLLTPVGCNLAGYSQQELASIMPTLPSNVKPVGGWTVDLTAPKPLLNERKHRLKLKLSKMKTFHLTSISLKSLAVC